MNASDTTGHKSFDQDCCLYLSRPINRTAQQVRLMEPPQQQKVLLLRSELPGPDKYASIFQEAGCEVFNVPTLGFVYQNLNTLAEQLNNPSQFSGIVFTSPRAVIATSEAMGGHLDPAWTSKLCFVVGEKTGGLVVEKLGLSHLGSDAGDASSLADVISAKVNDRNLPLLFPCGNLKKETLPKKLKDANIQLHTCTVYVTQQHPSLTAKLKEYLELRPDFAVYFSPSGVSFSQEVIKHADCYQQMKHVSIGPTTRDTLEKSGIEVFGSAARPCPEAVLEIIMGSPA